jgi:hypothetical protein
MATGRFESDTARNEGLLEAGCEGTPTVPYRALWAVLLLGWVISCADRTLTGPAIAWMTQNKAGFIGDAANPAALGGLRGPARPSRDDHRLAPVDRGDDRCLAHRGRARGLRRRPRAHRAR